MATKIVCAAIVSAVAATAAAAQQKAPEAPPAAYQSLLACQSIEQDQARLVCFDEQVRRFEKARQDRQMVVVDREQVREAKRGLFGITLPQLKLFSNDGEAEVQQIESSIAGLETGARGKWLVTLEDGARWAQTDTRSVRARVGDPIRIRQAAMGSFLANIGKQVAVRVKRVQ